MRMLGDEVYIQRGETWSLDFAVRNDKGHPFVVLKDWKNPYLAITVAAALYEQRGDLRETYWLDLKRRYVEQADGTARLEDFKRFISAEVLWLPNGFSVADAIEHYGVANGGKIVLDKTSDFDVTNFLFFADPSSDGNYVYRYVKDYRTDANGNVAYKANTYEEDVEWEAYDFRVIKQFNTKNWMEQGYFYDIKLLAGESTQERLISLLETQGVTVNTDGDSWTGEDWEAYLALVEDETARAELMALYEDGVPLLPSYDTKSLLLDPTPIYVSVNIQGGVK